MEKNYGGVIWTNHALTRLRDREIKQGDAWSVWKHPDSSRYSKVRNAWVYERTYGNQTIEVVARKNVRGEWLMLSVWSKPARFKKTRNKSLLGKALTKLLHSLFGKRGQKVI